MSPRATYAFGGDRFGDAYGESGKHIDEISQCIECVVTRKAHRRGSFEPVIEPSSRAVRMAGMVTPQPM
jgi:hypothetical protein